LFQLQTYLFLSSRTSTQSMVLCK